MITNKYLSLVVALACTAVVDRANAAPFTAGNLAIYRSDVIAGSDSPAAVFIDEYTPAGGLVQSLALPTAASGTQRALISQDDAELEGMLNRSTDGQYLLLSGYDHNILDPIPGSTTLAQSNAMDVPRSFGRIDAAGNIDTSTSYNDSGTGSPRSVISQDGLSLYVSQGSVSSDTTPDGGIRLTTFGSAGASTLVSNMATTEMGDVISADTRGIGFFDDQLFVSSATTNLNGLLSVDTVEGKMTGLDAIPGGNSSANTVQFFLADLSQDEAGVDTAYVTDSRNQAGGGGLRKYSLFEGSWTATGAIAGMQPAGEPAVSNLRGLTGVVNGSTVTLYGTRTSGGGGQLLSFTDSSGYNGTLTGTADLLTTATGKFFRGVAFVPGTPSEGLVGDYNGDDEVNAADFVMWREAVATQTALANDPLGLPIDDRQYNQWRENFGDMAMGAGGRAALGVVSTIPEPASCALLIIAGWMTSAASGRRDWRC